MKILMILEVVGQRPSVSTTFLFTYNWLYVHNIFTLSLADSIILINLYTKYFLAFSCILVIAPMVD